MLSDDSLTNWMEGVLNTQIIMGLAVFFALAGWCVWRLLVLIGWVNVKKKPGKTARTEKLSTQQPTKSQPPVSRKAIYSSRRYFS